MNKTFRLPLFVTFLFVHQVIFSQIDSIYFESAFAKLAEAKHCYNQNSRAPHCASMLRTAFGLSGNHAYFLEEILAFLIEKEDYWEARKYVNIRRIDTLSNSQKARHHHFKGILDLRSGFYHFTAAYQSFRKAYYCELRSSVPSFKLLSQIQNAMGYARMIYGGPNQSKEADYPHCNWITMDLISALKNFEQALYFDDENVNAQANRDTIIAKIKQSGLWVEEFEEQIKPQPIEHLRSDLLIEEKSKNDTLDLLNVNMLPNNKEMLLRIFEKYDELLLAVDISGSMEDSHATKGVSRFALMKELVLFLFHELPASTHVGIVSVGGSCGRHPRLYFPTEMDARKDIMDHIKLLQPHGNTPLIYSLARGKELYTKLENNKALFLISDGMERCGPPMDLCILAGDLYAMGVDLHIISFIVAGMEDSEFAYDIYKCMTRYSRGRIFRYDKDVMEEKQEEPTPIHEEELLLPRISFGNNLKGVIHFDVDLTEFFKGGAGIYLTSIKD